MCFSGFNVSVVCFLVCLVKMYKCYFFPSFGALGGHIVVYLGLEGLGVLCYLFLFFICLGFVFV